MSGIGHTEYKRKQRGRYFWDILRLEGRKQSFGTVGEGGSARRKAKRLALKLYVLEQPPADRDETATR